MRPFPRVAAACGSWLALAGLSVATAQTLAPFRAPDVWQRFTSRSLVQGPSRFVSDGDGGMMFWFQLLDRANGVRTGAPILLRADGSVNPAFQPGTASYQVGAVARTSDGKWLVSYSTTGAEVLVRLNADGSTDSGFEAKGFTQGIRFLTPLPNGDILVAVSGNQVGNPHPSAIVTPTGTVVKLFANGQLDPLFNRPVLQGGAFLFAPPVVDSQGRFYLGGNFTTAGTDPRINLARYLANGALDTTFAGSRSLTTTTLGGVVRGIGFQSDGKLVVVGNMLMPASLPPGVPSNQRDTNRFVALRFDANGQVDPTFQLTLRKQLSTAAAPDFPRMLLIQPDNRIVVAQDGLRRMTADGAPDPTFSAVNSAQVFWVGALADGRIVMPGGLPERGVTIVNSNGVPDSTFNVQGFGSTVDTTFSRLANGRVALAGPFNRVGSQPADGLLYLEADGTPAASQPGLSALAPGGLPEANGNAIAIAGNPAAGLFLNARVSGADPIAAPVFDGVRRINAAGLADTAYIPPQRAPRQVFPSADGTVWHAGITPQSVVSVIPAGQTRLTDSSLLLTHRTPNGSLRTGFLVRGPEEVDGLVEIDRNLQQIRLGGVRILAEGSDGAAYLEVAHVDGSVNLAKVDADGRDSNTFQSVDLTGFTPVEGFEALTEPGFNSPATYSILYYGDIFSTAVELSDGSLVVGGRFTGLPGGGQGQLALLKRDGSLDNTFHHEEFRNTKPFGIPSVLSVVRDELDRIYVAGDFDRYGNIPVRGLIRLDRTGRLDPTFVSPVIQAAYPQAAARLELSGSTLWVGGTFRSPDETFPRPLWKIDLGAIAGLPPLEPLPPAVGVGFQWPASLTGVVVEQVTDLGGLGNWAPANGTVTEVGGVKRFVVNPNAPMAFYRLRRVSE